ncbi:MAG: hypothetical protein K6F07_04030 [Bacilli bacterium]|nr:hypothetical protein [Bacilli bacterium]
MKLFLLGEVPESLYPNIGGKAKGLDLLIKAGFNVPRGFLIVDTEEINEEEIVSFFNKHQFNKVSVRSSASNEDGALTSHAGQYETYLFVDKEHLIERIKDCINSLKSIRSEEYQKHFNIEGKETMNIVVQEMIDSKKSGVIFTASPTNGSNILIEAVKGQGENLVSGMKNAHQYEISRKHFVNKEDDLLSSEEVKDLYDTAKKIRETFKGEMDIEWAMNGKLYILQMRPITTEVIDLEEFDRDEDLSNHLFTKRNVGEMMPGAVTPLTLSTSTKAIDYGMRYMLAKAGYYKTPFDVEPLKMISSFSGHLFFDMNLLYGMHSRVGIANPQSMNLSIMGEYHDYPKITNKYANPIVRGINSLRFLKYVFGGHKAMAKFDKLFDKVKFKETNDYQEKYEDINYNLRYLDESLIYHYASSSYSGSATSTLYMMLDKDFPDKKEYQAFLSHLLSNIPNIESADILKRLQEIASLIKEKEPKSLGFDEKELLAFIQKDPGIAEKYEEFLKIHGHRCIKEAELRNKPWRKEQLSLMSYLRSIINSPMMMASKEVEIDLKKEFAFIKKPFLRKMCISYAKKARQAVVDREYTKSRLIKIIDIFKTEYATLATLLTEANLLDDPDLIYFFTHEEIGLYINGDASLKKKAILRRKALPLQEELVFNDIYLGCPEPIKEDFIEGDGKLKGVPVAIGECEGIVRIINSVDDANKLKPGEIMVAKFTDIGWTPYYSNANGLITEIGSSLSHGAVVAREYGLPTIVNVANATKRLKNGDHIKMDATKGIVTIIN